MEGEIWISFPVYDTAFFSKEMTSKKRDVSKATGNRVLLSHQCHLQCQFQCQFLFMAFSKQGRSTFFIDTIM